MDFQLGQLLLWKSQTRAMDLLLMAPKGQSHLRTIALALYITLLLIPLLFLVPHIQTYMNIGEKKQAQDFQAFLIRENSIF